MVLSKIYLLLCLFFIVGVSGIFDLNKEVNLFIESEWIENPLQESPFQTHFLPTDLEDLAHLTDPVLEIFLCFFTLIIEEKIRGLSYIFILTDLPPPFF